MGEYFDMKERRVSIDLTQKSRAGYNPEPEPDVDSRNPSRVNSANFILENYDRSRSHHQYYPGEPSPLHFTHLNSPSPINFMGSPMRSYSFDKEQRRRRRCGRLTSCCCCSIVTTLCSLVFTTGILLGFASLIAWLILRPIYAPSYSVDNLEFRSFIVSAPISGVSGGAGYALNADVVITITAENRNGKLGFKYDAVDVETSYRGLVFGHSSVSSFSLGHSNTTILTSEFVVENFFVTPPGLGPDLFADVTQFASVALHVRATAKVRVQVGVITSFAVKVFVDCDFVVRPPNGTAPSSVISKTCNLTR